MSAAAALKWDELESRYFHRTYYLGAAVLAVVKYSTLLVR